MATNQRPQSSPKPKILSLDWWNSISGVVGAVGALATLAGLGIAYAALPHPHPAPPTQLARTPALGLEFRQDNQPAPMKRGTQPKGDYVPRTIVQLKSAPFSLRAPKLAGKVGVAFSAWRDDSIFNLKPGSNVDDPAYGATFRNGTYLATVGDQADPFLSLNKNSYSFLSDDNTKSLGNEEFENVYYQVNNPPDRVPGFNAASPANPFNMPAEVATAQDLKDLAAWHNDIYLVAWKDRNQNRVIDDDEYEYITLDFPPHSLSLQV